MLWCLGLGLLLAGIRSLAGLLLGESRLICAALDLLAFVAAAVAVCGFAAGLSASGVVRWYMPAAMALGAFGWQQAVFPVLQHLCTNCVHIAVLPLCWMENIVLLPIICRIRTAAVSLLQRKFAGKRQKKQKKSKLSLQKRRRVLYN